MQQSSSYSVDVAYHSGTNGHPDNHSPNSSHLSVHSGEATLVSRTQQQKTTQQVEQNNSFINSHVQYLTSNFLDFF